MSNLLVTGGCGFIGSNFIRCILNGSDVSRVINLDKLTYAGSRANLSDIETIHAGTRYFFVRGDISDRELVGSLLDGTYIDEKIGPASSIVPDTIVNFAAETHVDRSIEDSDPFIQTNIVGTHVLLETAQQQWKVATSGGNEASGTSRGNLFLQISTDEVYGCLGKEGYFTEESPLRPNSPYAASKAAADLLVRSYHQTYGLPVITTRSCNNYGPYQFPEKFIPLMIINALSDRPLPIYGDGRNVRDWIHVDDHCNAIALVIQRGVTGEVYNIGSRAEKRNIDVAESILRLTDKPETAISFVEDRLGHDWRYAIDPVKINELGWYPSHGFDKGLEQTLRWYAANPDWCRERTEMTSKVSLG